MPPVFIPNEGLPVEFTAYFPVTTEDDGLAFFGGNFHPQTLVNAYLCGLFPWYIHDGFPFWYCPDPRMVLFPERLKISKSMRNVFNRNIFSYSSDVAFEAVIKHCASVRRKGEQSSWIDEDFIEAYSLLHALGVAHSFECWKGTQLVGGLYGLAIGQVFFGESMFSLEPNASKAALIRAVRFLSLNEFKMIDCQIYTEHLSSLGATPVSRYDYLTKLSQWSPLPALNEMNWTDVFKMIER